MVDNDDIERLREIFVTRQECNTITDSLESKLNKDNVRLAVMESELKQIKWLLGLVLAGTVANLVNSFFGMMG